MEQEQKMTLPKNTFNETYSSSDDCSPRSPRSPGGLIRKQNKVSKMIDQRNSQDNKQHLYQNTGQRVLQIRDVNEFYEKKIISQEQEIKILQERVNNKRILLEKKMRGHGQTKDKILLHNADWINNYYQTQSENKDLKMSLKRNHIENDPEVIKAEKQNSGELFSLKNTNNNFIKEIEQIKHDINVLRKENGKLKSNLISIVDNKDYQNIEMNKMSEEANGYLKQKDKFNEELMKMNKKIAEEKAEHEAKMKELDKMIDNTKKTQQFNETLAYEKFAIKPSKYYNDKEMPANKIIEERGRLKKLDEDLLKSKRMTVFLLFSRLILLKKQNHINKIIDNVKSETGVDSLDKLNSDLQLSTETNRKFEKDLRVLYQQKKDLDQSIAKKQEEIRDANIILNDGYLKLDNKIKGLKEEVGNAQEKKDHLDKRFFGLNRLMNLMAKILKDFCNQLNFCEYKEDLEAQTTEHTLANCMDFFEHKIIEIIQMNTDISKDAALIELEENRNMQSLQSLCDGMSKEEHEKLFDKKKCLASHFNLKDIQDISKEMTVAFIKKYEANK